MGSIEHSVPTQPIFAEGWRGDHGDAASVDKRRFIGISEWDLCRVVTMNLGVVGPRKYREGDTRI